MSCANRVPRTCGWRSRPSNGRLLDRVAWLNMGGGHLMTHAEYDCDELIALLREFRSRHPHLRLILEPGSAFTWRTGYLVSTVEDLSLIHI